MFKFYYYATYPITAICLFFLLIYRKILTRAKGARCCKFIPSCSNYAWESIIEFGWLFGGILTLKRLLRCRPNNPAGVDYPKLNLLGNYKWKC